MRTMSVLQQWSRATMWIHIVITLFNSQTTEQVIPNVYVSQRKGSDTLNCGSITKPCKTIVMGVLQAKQNTRVFVDGTGSETTPYTCKSSFSEFPGIHTNKSLEIVGVQSLVHVKCQKGYDVRFEKSLLYGNETIVSLTNIKFINTTIKVQDISLNINDCILSDVAQGVSVVQSTRSFSMSFTSSLCMNTGSCICVNVSGEVLPANKISIDIRNSKVVSSWLTEGEQASGIHVTSTGEYSPGPITCDIKLHNVTFKHNALGKNGLIFVLLTNSFTSLNLESVLFSENVNKAGQHTISLIAVKKSNNTFMVLNNTHFTSCGGLCRAVHISTKNQNLIISNSRFEQFSIGSQAGVLYLDSENDCNVSMENATFVNNNGTTADGGCMFLNSGTAVVMLKDSLFIKNTGNKGGVLWIYSQYNVSLNISNCIFESNFASDSGGLAIMHGMYLFLIMTNSTVTNSAAGYSGAVFDIGFRCFFTQPFILNATILFKNVHVSNCSFDYTGGLLVLNAVNEYLEIQDSVIQDIKTNSNVEGNGGILSANPYGQHYISPTIDIKINNVLFENIISACSCSALSANGVRNFSMENARIYNASSFLPLAYVPSDGGAFCVSFDDITSNLNLNNIIVKNSFADNEMYGTLMFSSSYDIVLAVKISNSVFESNGGTGSGGCLNLDSHGHILLHNVTFKECYTRGNSGGALALTLSKLSHSYTSYVIKKTKVTIDSCKFIGNTAFGGDGGALNFVPGITHVGQDEIKDEGCIFDSTPSHRTWHYAVSLLINNTIFVNNTAVNGGALALSTGKHIITGCSFIDNFSQLQGGHIFMTSDTTTLHVRHSKFLQKHSSITVKLADSSITYQSNSLGSFINSQSIGPLTIHNSELKSMLPQRNQPTKLVFVSKGNYIRLGGNNLTLVTCARGSSLDVDNYTNILQVKSSYDECEMDFTLLQFTCIPCPVDAYSLQYGKSLGKNKVSDFHCLTCPYGAVCNSKISAKPNLWGYKVKENPVELNFTLCPLGYCQSPPENDFLEYNSCQGNRTGTLCGHCKENYSETLLSPHCRHDDECHDNWVWGVAVVMATLMALYLIHKPDLGHILKNQILWFKCCRKEENEQDESQDHGGAGYLKIVFYFYQVVNILLVTNSYEKVIQSYVLHPVVGIFNFQFRFSSNGFLCPFPGLTAVTKQLLFASQVLGVVVMIAVCYVCHCLLRKCRSKPPPNLAPYLGAVLETLLLGYAVFANTSLQLLRCTSLGQDSHLFIAGKVVCYQWWQYILMVFVGVVVFPFILILAFGSHWLYKGTISIKEFLIGCVLPLPYLIYKLISLVCTSTRPSQEPVELKASVTNVLYGPFRISKENTFGAVYWESILVSRRLLLIAIYVFVSDPFLKEILLTLSCVSILLHHTIVRPFREDAANIAEIVSLFTLVVVASINTFKASFLSTGQELQGPLKSIAVWLDWVQIIILIVLPVLLIVAVLFAIVCLVIRLIRGVFIFVMRWRIRCQETSDEGRRLLNPAT